MTLKDKAKWFSFEVSFFAQSYAYACAYIDACVAHFAAFLRLRCF